MKRYFTVLFLISTLALATGCYLRKPQNKENGNNEPSKESSSEYGDAKFVSKQGKLGESEVIPPAPGDEDFVQ